MATNENLATAFAGESQANRKYTAFAKKADEEGLPQVARLFRAAAAAETVHALAHFRAMGGVKSTAENLQAAIDGETYEKETMYPEFLAAAEAEEQDDAYRTFNFAKAAEADHASLYAAALADLEGWKTGAKTFFVCPICGRTVTTVDFDSCSVCGEAGSAYESIA